MAAAFENVWKMDAAEYTEKRIEEIRQDAERYNCDVVVADDKTLQLDLDTPAAQKQFRNTIGILESRFPDMFTKAPNETWESKSGNQHVVIHLAQPLPAEQRIMLQAILGSDGKREALNLARVKNIGAEEAIVLFKPRPKAAA